MYYVISFVRSVFLSLVMYLVRTLGICLVMCLVRSLCIYVFRPRVISLVRYFCMWVVCSLVVCVHVCMCALFRSDVRSSIMYLFRVSVCLSLVRVLSVFTQLCTYVLMYVFMYLVMSYFLC